MADIYITGIGAVTPLGTTWPQTWAGLKEQRSAIDALTLFDPPGTWERAAEIPAEYDWKTRCLSTQTFADRCTQIAIGAAREALEAAEYSVPLPADGDPVGLCFGTEFGCLEASETFFEPVGRGNGRRASSLVFSHSYPNCPTSFLAIELGLRGYSTSFAGSAEAGLWALKDAIAALQSGDTGAILVGASDALTPARVAHAEVSTAAGTQATPGEASLFFLIETEQHLADRDTRAKPLPFCPEAGRAMAAEISRSIGTTGASLPLLALVVQAVQ